MRWTPIKGGAYTHLVVVSPNFAEDRTVIVSPTTVTSRLTFLKMQAIPGTRWLVMTWIGRLWAEAQLGAGVRGR